MKHIAPEFVDLFGQSVGNISAIVLNWKRPDNVNKIVRYLAKKEYINEIIIWNNSAEPFLAKLNDCRIRVINSEKNLRDEAKYLACAEANNDYCYYQDDDWYTDNYLDMLYHSFSQNPDHIHTTSSASILAENRLHSYYNANKKIHAEFSWIGCGSMFKRSIAQDFLGYIHSNFDQTSRAMADRVFTVYHNQPTVQLEVALVPLNQNDAYSHQPQFLDNRQKVSSYIHQMLLQRGSVERELPRYIFRSILKDVALFTSFPPIKYPLKEIQYHGKSDYENRRVEDIKDDSFHMYLENSYIRALGPDPNRRWMSEFQNGDTWGAVSPAPSDFELEVEVQGTNGEDRIWRVKTETENLDLSDSELTQHTFYGTRVICCTYIGNRPEKYRIKVLKSNAG